tara:strand:- start:2166 stop:2351 length:186 start_codon:yes stop_codon:yes gene_type:complete
MILKMQTIIEKICPTTLLLNVGAIGISLSQMELTLKLISYSIAIIWTTIKVVKELKDWNKK